MLLRVFSGTRACTSSEYYDEYYAGVVDALRKIGDNSAIRAEDVEIEKSGHRTGASCGEMMAATAFCSRESDKRFAGCNSKVITVNISLRGEGEYAELEVLSPTPATSPLSCHRESSAATRFHEVILVYLRRFFAFRWINRKSMQSWSSRV
jgi:hypothetical protein